MFSLHSIDDDHTAGNREDLLNLAEIRRTLSDHLDMCRFVSDEYEGNWIDLVRQREDDEGNEDQFDLASSYQILMTVDPEDRESVISDVSEDSIDPECDETFGTTIARNAERLRVENRSLFSPVPVPRILQESRPATPFPTLIAPCNCSICVRLNTNRRSGGDYGIFSPSATQTTSGGETEDEDTHVDEMYGEIDTQIIIERNSLHYSSDEDA